MTRIGLACAILLLSGAARAGPGRLQVLQDSQTPRANRTVHDVKHVSFEIVDDTLEVTIQFRRSFPEMMFQAADIEFDCDDDASTGINGMEFRVRTSVGSRFHPNSWRPEEGAGKPPLEQRRCGVADVRTYTLGADATVRANWVWRGNLTPPEVSDGKLIQRIPLKRLRDRGLRYNRHVPLYLRVEGTCSESPIPLRHLVTDEGVGITADGKPGDWSGGTRAVDETGELHPDAAGLDIAKVQVDHRKKELMVGVWLAKRGFEDMTARDDLDVRDTDRITVSVEPLGGEYLGYRQYVLYAGIPRMNAGDWGASTGDRFAEFIIRRPPAQNSFRVIVWSDAVRTDRVPDEGTFRLDTGTK